MYANESIYEERGVCELLDRPMGGKIDIYANRYSGVRSFSTFGIEDFFFCFTLG